MTDAPTENRASTRPVPLLVLAALLTAEGLALAAVTVFLIVELIAEVPDSYASAIGVTVLAALAAAWLITIGINTVRGRAWIRGAAITVQVLLLAIAIGSFQGLFARTDIGWLLLAPAVAVLVLLFTPSVLASTTARD